LTVKLFAPDSVAPVANRLIAFTTQGFVSVVGGSVGIISRPIENSLQPLLTNAVAGFKSAVFGVGYETERLYLCWMPTAVDETTCAQAFVYNVLANCWTRRTDTRGCGRVSPTDLLYLGSTTTNTLVKERKTFAYSDFADETYSVTITTGGSSSVIVSTPVAVGDYLIKSTSRALITAYDAGTGTATISREAGSPSFTTGAATVHAGYQCTLIYNPQTGGEPGLLKQFQEVTLLFDTADFSLGNITSTNSRADTTGTDSSSVSSALALNEGASILLGTYTLLPGTGRMLLPLENQRNYRLGVGFKIREARARWRLCGYTLEAVPGSSRVTRNG
jgi:hypothetical protein